MGYSALPFIITLEFLWLIYFTSLRKMGFWGWHRMTVCSVDPAFDYTCKFWYMWLFHTSSERVEGKEREWKKRVRKRTAPTPVRWQNRWPNLNTAPQAPKTVGWHYVCVCSHACALSCFCVNVHSDEVRSELRGGALPATQRQTAGWTFKSWGLAPVGLRICPRIVSSRPYCM